MTPPQPILRPEVPGDEPFLFAVYSSTREEELNAMGWPAEARNAFLTIQFRAMRQGYQTSFPRAAFSIILVEGEPVGRMVVDRGSMEFRLVDIALLPTLRSRGIGGFLLRQLLSEAGESNKSVVLQVLQGNRAELFYRRLGFEVTEASGLYRTLRWQPASSRVRCG